MDKETVREHTEAVLSSDSFFIVDIEVKKDTINVYVDKDEEEVGINDCTEISRGLSERLDLGAYNLNVSSAGFTQPFKVFRQYKKNIGQPVEVYLKDSSRKTGTLISAEKEKGITLELKDFKKAKKAKSKTKQPEEENIFIDFNEINMTKGIVTF
ncbi:MAG: ribosome assembly cofactor RimP [Bacteroidales bacterium]|nr:ribosome assembly cofactor RimP [Bacteroidales bacterium]MCF8332876.1 ribosome assembly cofactor RimP [Bacteroidales bacterium]